MCSVEARPTPSNTKIKPEGTKPPPTTFLLSFKFWLVFREGMERWKGFPNPSWQSKQRDEDESTVLGHRENSLPSSPQEKAWRCQGAQKVAQSVSALGCSHVTLNLRGLEGEPFILPYHLQHLPCMEMSLPGQWKNRPCLSAKQALKADVILTPCLPAQNGARQDFKSKKHLLAGKAIQAEIKKRE